MFKVIKNPELLLCQPRIIDSDIYEEIELKSEEESQIPVDDSSQEKEELEQVELEAEKILSETENMVMELLQKARDEAKDIIANAQEEADVIKSQVYEESRKIREQAHTEGYNTGLERARQEIEEERQHCLKESQQIIEDARKIKRDMFNSSEEDILRLVMAIARKVVAEEISINPAVIINVIREAVGFIDKPDNVTLYVNPKELAKVVELIKMEKFNDIGNKDVNIEAYADSRISLGGCVAESEAGSVDSRIETRIDNINNSIQEVKPDE